jgi:GNAT superfamily N-acetyltransferase
VTLLPGAARAFDLLTTGRFGELGEKLAHRMRASAYEIDESYGLRRDLRAAFTAPAAKIPITIREASARDAAVLFGDEAAELDPAASGDIAWRREIFAAGLPTCFVAVDTRTDTPCYVQWLMGASQNAQIKSIGCFPTLGPDEALLENAFTPSRYRGMGIMPAAMALIAERASDLGANTVITFVHRDNVASLKGCERAGFSPYVMRRRARYCFNLIERVGFNPLPAAAPLLAAE